MDMNYNPAEEEKDPQQDIIDSLSSVTASNLDTEKLDQFRSDTNKAIVPPAQEVLEAMEKANQTPPYDTQLAAVVPPEDICPLPNDPNIP